MVQTGHKGNEGVVRVFAAGFRNGRIYATFTGSRMKIDNHFVPAILSGRHAPENKLSGGGRNLPQREILRWRTHENKIVATSFVKREHATRLDTNMASGFFKQAVQFQNSLQFADSSVVLIDSIARVSGGFEIAESSLWIADEKRVAKDDDRFLRSMKERVRDRPRQD
jgi:hypothetical protein